MKTLAVLLNFGTSLSVPLSTTLFWVVVVLLVGLFFFFYFRTIKILDEKKQEEIPTETSASENINPDVQGETAAAIALAMHMYKAELHDKESFTLTLKKVSRIYSPWSSKIYTLRQNPR
jgi:glutaconyl-CoA/methylmalonyl-CoA decarboxylase subunit delta